MLRKFLRKHSDSYAKLFSQGKRQKLNEEILRSALKARGYNNYQNNQLSGEAFFIEEILKGQNPKICLDIGANVGNYTAELLRKTDAIVYCFEPLTSSFEKLSKLTEEFGDRVRPYRLGVGDRIAQLPLFYNDTATEHATFSTEVAVIPYLDNTDTTIVDITTIDSFCMDNEIVEIDLIKIDTEGFEYEVLLGAVNTLKNVTPKFVQIEFNLHQMFRGQSLYSLAKLLPYYDCYQLTPNSWQKRDPSDPLCNVYHFSNFVFVRR